MSLALSLALSASAGAVVGALAARRRAPPVTARTEPATLSAALDALPVAVVLFADEGRIALANASARALFFEGRDVVGENFLAMLATAPAPLRRALAGEGDGLYAVEGAPERVLITRDALTVDGAAYALLTARDVTRELAREEAAAWKRAIRVMSHEVNNSVAPIASLMETARTLARGHPHEARLARVFETVGERVLHLAGFLEGYATLARLGTPKRAPVAWSVFLKRIAALHPDVRVGEAPAGEAHVDAAQLEQAVINLLKNAREAGSAPGDVELTVTPDDDGVSVCVRDRGRGVSAEVAAHATMPFYTTKDRGSGLGLALCREVAEAHGGTARLEAREGGGAVATLWIPTRTSASSRGASRSVHFTLTRDGATR